MTRLAAPQGTQAVLRAIRLLKTFSSQEPELSLAQMGDRLALTKSTTHRLLRALESEGLVARNGELHTYHLGQGLVALCSQALLSGDLRSTVRPVLEQLATKTGETTTLEILVGDRMLVLDGIPGRKLVCATLDIGTRWPLHATSTGKCVLAGLSEERCAAILSGSLERFTPSTVTQRTQLRAELHTIRRQGFATTREELEPDYVAVAAEFRDSFGAIEGAISIGGPASRMTRNKVRALGRLLRASTKDLSQRPSRI